MTVSYESDDKASLENNDMTSTYDSNKTSHKNNDITSIYDCMESDDDNQESDEAEVSILLGRALQKQLELIKAVILVTIIVLSITQARQPVEI